MSIFGTDKMDIRKKSDVKKDETVVPSNEDVNVDEVMRKYDRESNTRIWQGVPKAVITSVMVLFSVYCLLMTLFSVEQAETRLARFLAFVIVIGYLMYPVKKTGHSPNHIPWYDIVLMVVGAGSFVYFSVNAVDIMMMGTRIGTLEVVLGICGIAVLIELCRRCVGIPIIVVVGCLLIYAFYWQFSHGADAYRALSNIVQKLFYTTSGVIGTPTNVCYTYIVLFIIFGAFLERTGIANFFISFANRLAGWSSGGPAKVAVISSALCGMVSGSSVGNTVTTGSVTIPMMKKTGYRPEFAGAVEAASSTGGQIMPPIMGAAAFLMAEYMGIPYIQVAAIAIIPALLYFGGIFCTVHLEAKARGLKGIPFNELPTWIYLLKNCYLIIPLVVLVWIVSAGIYTMAVSAAISIFVAFVIGFIHFLLTNWEERTEEDTFGSVLLETCKTALWTAADAFAAGARNSIAVAVACALAGMIAGCITVTGLASMLINAIVLAAGDFLIIGLILTMLCCIVLGIAKSKPMKTAVTASRLGIAAYIVPFVFAFCPALIMQAPVEPYMVVLNTAMALFGLFGVASGLQGYLFGKINPILRVFAIVAGVAIMIPMSEADGIASLGINAIGFLFVFGVFAYQKLVHGKKDKGTKATA